MLKSSAPLHIRIFLSSPGDVTDERGLALQVIDLLPYDPLLRGKITVEVVAWDKKGVGVPMLATLTPQEAVNQGLPKPSDCDIVVVIFWSHMGTPLPPEFTKPDGNPYLSGTEWEYEDAFQAAARSADHPSRPQILVYRRIEKVLLDDEAPNYAARLEQKRRVKAFFDSFMNPDGSIRRGYNSYITPDDFREQFSIHLRYLVKQFLEEAQLSGNSLTSTKPLEPWKGSPFPGLRAFTPEDAPIFFGRGRETDQLLKRVEESPFVMIIGSSGSGKSSLVGAGLLPRLMANAIEGSKDWVYSSFTPGGVGNNPFMALASGLISDIPSLKKLFSQPRILSDMLLTTPSNIDGFVSTILADRSALAKLFLFIDQFEEMFTLVSTSYQQVFIDYLFDMVKTTRIKLVATLRSDFYHRCMDYPELAELLQIGSYPLAIPKAGALYEMIVRPADCALLEFESGLADQILEDTGSNPGALALLAYTLDELFQTTAHKGRRLTFAAYKSLGGVQGAIGTRAQNVFEKLDDDTQAALPLAFRELVRVDEYGVATRQRVALANLQKNPNALTLVEKLTEQRLLVQSLGQNHQPMVEVAHESLFHSWEQLAKWIEVVQDDLFLLRQVEQAIDLWERNQRHEDFLWTGRRLKEARDAVERQHIDLTESQREFLRTEVDRLEEKLSNSTLDHAVLAKIGERLHVIGDTRKGVGLRPDGLPDIEWCYVPPGKVKIEPINRYFMVDPFYISKYPITNLQFRSFQIHHTIYNDIMSENNAEGDRDDNSREFSFSNYPRVMVCWFQAIAFCRWLNARLMTIDLPPLLAGEKEFQIRLPTEWEWQQAATNGISKNTYPWGPKWNSQYANTDDSGLFRTTAVGMYPLGRSGCGALDMSGNVQEWCLNDYDNLEFKELGDQDRCCSRGGSWYDDQDIAKTTTRYSLRPNYRDNNLGFRVVLAVKLVD